MTSRSMDEMMGMSFDELRSTTAAATMMGSQQLLASTTGPRASSQRPPLPPAVIPDHPHELDVFLSGPGAEKQCARGVSTLSASEAEVACRGKNDFILLEPLDAAVREQRRLVIVMPLNAGRSSLSSSQAHRPFDAH